MRRHPMRRIVTAALSAAVVLAGLVLARPAQADFRQWGVVSADPVDWTPHVLNGSVTGAAIVGSVVVVGGTFGEVQDSRSGRSHRQRYLFAFDRSSGAIADFGPDL